MRKVFVVAVSQVPGVGVEGRVHAVPGERLAYEYWVRWPSSKVSERPCSRPGETSARSRWAARDAMATSTQMATVGARPGAWEPLRDRRRSSTASPFSWISTGGWWLKIPAPRPSHVRPRRTGPAGVEAKARRMPWSCDESPSRPGRGRRASARPRAAKPPAATVET